MSTAMQSERATSSPVLSAAVRSVLFTLRVAIGWHFLYEGLSKILAGNWTSGDYLATAQWLFGGLFRSIAGTPWLLKTVDWLTMAALLLIGTALILGAFTRAAGIAGMLLLLAFYVAHPPFDAISAASGGGNYLAIDRNIIEALTLLALSLLPFRELPGLDRLWSNGRRTRLTAASGDLTPEAKIAMERRDLLANLSGVPLIGGMALAILGSRKPTSQQVATAQNRDAFVAGASTRAPAGGPLSPTGHLASVRDFEWLAPTRMSKTAWEFVDSGAGDDLTARWNQTAFTRIYLHQNTLEDVSKIDTRIVLFGLERPHPILLSPVSSHGLVHPDGERATAKGAGIAGATMVVSTFATEKIEDIAKASSRPLWHGTYLMKDRARTREMIDRATASGYEAICVPVDTPVVGARDREHRTYRFSDRAPMSFMKHPVDYYRYPVTWKDIEWYRAQTKLPLLVKGILNPEDADRAILMGVNGIFVSNHGGRNCDTLPATIDVLPRIVDKVAGRVPVIMDSGIRRGTDVLKALAYGASAVSIGRPYIYGLAIKGVEGVAGVVNILRNELEMAMAQTGRPTIASINRTVIESRNEIGRTI